MKLGGWLTGFSVNRPRLTAGLITGLALAAAGLAALPTVFPETFPMLHPVRVDTDPENMLSADEAARVFHNDMKRLFDLNEIVVLGVVNESRPEGVFNPETLARVHELTEYAKTLQGAAIGQKDPRAGVVGVDVIAPSTVDNIEQGGLGEVKFEWLMPSPPATPEEAAAVRDRAARIPFLQGTLVSESGKALCLYLPLTSKDLSHRVYTRLRAKIAEMPGDDKFYITGLPVANDTFGVEMFIQMAVSAPLAMLVIFLLMLWFFRKLTLIIAPMALALIIVLQTMGLLVITGNTIHIMSSMIPIFLMPISILDSIHILSEFFERYQQYRDRRKTVMSVMDTLFMPMLYTSLTSAAGFASLAITPIPPVQVFGIFVALGVMLAWLFTVMFIPAFIMLIPEKRLEGFGAAHHADDEAAARATRMGRLLAALGRFTWNRAKLVLAGTAVVTAVAAYGITRIEVNDNPTRWFKASHPIREADRVLNSHFGGTYMAYLALLPEEKPFVPEAYGRELAGRVTEWGAKEGETWPELAAAAGALAGESVRLAPGRPDKAALLDALTEFADTRAAEEGADPDAWDEAVRFLDAERQRDELFKQPEVLRYMETLQAALQATGTVGKTNSLADLVKTVHRELMEGNPEYFRVPDTANAVAQCLITYESSHRPQDLLHFVTHDYRKSSLWVQLKSGNNRDMKAVVDAVAAFAAQNPPPAGLRLEWFGLTYINVVWQEKMVVGMLQAFLGSFLVVLFMMIVLFRSGLWGLLSMVPLTVTIGLIYGVIGLAGKDYDMPVAVLSSLTLGLAVDFAIHFLSRARSLHAERGSWAAAAPLMFGEPGRAILRNVIAVAVGFTPLLLAPLVPYNTVGVFMAAILGASGVATLLILPALMRLLEPMLFPATGLCRITCSCCTCAATAATLAGAVVVNLKFLGGTWTQWTAASLLFVAAAVAWCALMSRRQSCAPQPGKDT
ncbi:MAG: MMPL family transporter [Candidatus Hydrogenedens sp.]|nr:MMPL family transporter [Candidatus Hydrogenedens sp.]